MRDRFSNLKLIDRTTSRVLIESRDTYSIGDIHKQITSAVNRSSTGDKSVHKQKDIVNETIHPGSTKTPNKLIASTVNQAGEFLTKGPIDRKQVMYTLMEYCITSGFSTMESAYIIVLCFLESRFKINSVDSSSGAAGIAGQMPTWYREYRKIFIANTIAKLKPLHLKMEQKGYLKGIPKILAVKDVATGKWKTAINSRNHAYFAVVMAQYASVIPMIHKILKRHAGGTHAQVATSMIKDVNIHPEFKQILIDHPNFVNTFGVLPIMTFVAWAEGSGMIYGQKFHNEKYKNYMRPNLDMAIMPEFLPYIKSWVDNTHPENFSINNVV